jgi:calcineurin-like phosphoesterase family protein
MRFRDDIDLDKTYIVSDTHFGHDNIVGFCHRPEEHEQVMIAEWRAHVPDDATVLHLGDLTYRGNARFKHLIAKELTGERKLLIKGNHDKQSFKFYKDCGFKLARPFGLCLRVVDGHFEPFVPSLENRLRTDNDYVVSFSHYSWSVDDKSAMLPGEDPDALGDGVMDDRHWRIHGHIHNNGYQRSFYVPFLKNHINMSIEQTKYRPVNLRLLLEGAILGVLPASAEEEAALTDAAKERSRERRSREAT